MVGRAKRLGGLLVVINLAVVVIILLTRLSVLPRRLSSSVTVSATYWTRLATFYVLSGHKDVNDMMALLADTVTDCRSLPTNPTSSVCQGPSDVYLLYSNDDELQAAQVVVNTTR